MSILALPAIDYLRIEVPRFGTSNLYSAHLVVSNLDLAQAACWIGAGGLSALMAFCSCAAAYWLVHPFQGIPLLDKIGEQATHLSRRMNPLQNSAILPIGAGLRSVVAICNEHQLPNIWKRRGVQSLASINLQLVLSDVSWFDGSGEERDQSH